MRFSRKVYALVLGAVLALASAQAFAQGCAMCRANAKATPKEAQKAINRAIAVMLLPPLGVMFLGTRFVIGYARRRDRENGSKS